ncbi:hypothetical protein [Nonomuraea sp. NPDC005650]|uniref:hypothetical protein n=1 Tax=Nonomuraea sp. NPDC005650 TaxID=3157045 RepID=UPI00339DFBDB
MSSEPTHYQVWDATNDVWVSYDLPLPAAKTKNWRVRFDVDNEGWWLVKDGRRCNRRPWQPADAWEALVAADLLWALNDAGPTPITREYRAAADRVGMSPKEVAWELRKASFGLWLRKLIR